ncbi:MAG: hypothetical protein JO165_11645, partial [Candidatus Eremiobacteraeota bacterium]|nr:hypothetical protein [Candidatus Eremiobacteraeota bacterium]
RASGHYYCGIYSARPGDCRDFTPIGCQDVDAELSHSRRLKLGEPFKHGDAKKRKGF